MNHAKVVRSLALAVAVAVSAVGLASLTKQDGAFAAAATLRVEPATQSVANGQQFTITVMRNSDVATQGVGADLLFAQTLVQVVDVQPGPAWSELLVGVVPETKEQAIASANLTGILQNLTVSNAPATAPAGDSVAFVITMLAISGASGQSPLDFAQVEILDSTGTLVPTTSSPGAVNVTGAATFTPSPTPTFTVTPTPVGTSTASPTRTPTITPLPGTNTPTPTQVTPTVFATLTPAFTPIPATLKVDPPTVTTGPNGEFTVKIVQDAPVVSVGASASLNFDRTLIQLLKIEKGTAYESAVLAYGALGESVGPGTPTPITKTELEVISEANETTGFIANIAVSFSASGQIPAGPETAFTLTFRAKKGVSGTSPITLCKFRTIQPTVVPTATPVAGTPVVPTATLSPPFSECKKGGEILAVADTSGDKIGVTVTNGEVKIEGAEATTTPTPAATVVGTTTAVATATTASVNTVQGSSASPAGSTATGLPNAGAWFGPDGTRWMIMAVSCLTLLASLIALANTWIRRRRT